MDDAVQSDRNLWSIQQCGCRPTTDQRIIKSRLGLESLAQFVGQSSRRSFQYLLQILPQSSVDTDCWSANSIVNRSWFAQQNLES
jgi:hypothetical protein